MNFLPYAIGLGVIAGLGILIHKLINKNYDYYCHCALFEKIGNQEVYIGLKKVFKVQTNAVTCIKISGEPHSYMDLPNSDDFFPTKIKGVSKVLFVTRFGERDYRVKKKFDDTWFKKVTKPVYDEVEEFDPVSKEYFVTRKPRLDTEGNIILEVSEDFYSEPLGITQTGMESIRAGLQNEREINKNLESTKFWDKYGTSIVFIAGLMIVALLVIKSTQNVADASMGLVDTCKEASDNVNGVAERVNNPLWAEKVLDYVNKRNDEKTAPPS